MKKPRRPTRNGYALVRGGTDDSHDAIEIEFLGLWFGLARLHELVRHPKKRSPSMRPPDGAR